MCVHQYAVGDVLSTVEMCLFHCSFIRQNNSAHMTVFFFFEPNFMNPCRKLNIPIQFALRKYIAAFINTLVFFSVIVQAFYIWNENSS